MHGTNGQLIVDDPQAPAYQPTPEEVAEATDMLMQCSPELTLPYEDKKAPRVMPTHMVLELKKRIGQKRLARLAR